MKSGMVNGIRLRRITPDSITRTGPLAPNRVDTWTVDREPVAGREFDQLYLVDATLSNDYRGIIASTIAGIEGTGGQISTSWIDRDQL